MYQKPMWLKGLIWGVVVGFVFIVVFVALAVLSMAIDEKWCPGSFYNKACGWDPFCSACIVVELFPILLLLAGMPLLLAGLLTGFSPFGVDNQILLDLPTIIGFVKTLAIFGLVGMVWGYLQGRSKK